VKVLHKSLNDRDLARLQADTFKYFLQWNPENGLIPDSCGYRKLHPHFECKLSRADLVRPLEPNPICESYSLE